MVLSQRPTLSSHAPAPSVRQRIRQRRQQLVPPLTFLICLLCLSALDVFRPDLDVAGTEEPGLPDLDVAGTEEPGLPDLDVAGTEEPGRFVALTFSAAMEEFAVNMLRSLEPHLGTAKVKAFVTGAGGCASLSAQFPAEVVWLECTQMPETGEERSDTGSTVIYKSAHYLAQVHKKLDMNILVMRSVPAGSLVMFTDVDVVYFNDPFTFEQDSSPSGLWFSAGEGAHKCGDSKDRGLVNTGLYFVKATPFNRDIFFQQAKMNLLAKKSYDKGDQGAIQYTLNRRNLSYKILPCELFANGNIYWGNMDGKKNVSQFVSGAMEDGRFVSLHANYIVRSDLKKRCLQLTGYWYNDRGEGRRDPSSLSRFEPKPVNVALKDGVIVSCEAVAF